MDINIKQSASPEEAAAAAAADKEVLIMALNDICARMDLNATAMMNSVTAMMQAISNINNTKNHYLELIGKLRQESISSK